MRCIYVPSWKITFAVAPKCGSSSLHDALERQFDCTDLVQCDDVMILRDPALLSKNGRVVAVVRSPIARFISLWCNKCRDGGKLVGHQGKVDGLSVDEMLSYVRTHDNHHWTPQAEMYANLGNVTYVMLEGFTRYWNEQTPATVVMRPRNVTVQRPTLKLSQIAELYDIYSADIDLLKQVELLDVNGQV
jgi:hypothetical protein